MISAAQARQMLLSLPEAQELETWGEATFRVRHKIFAMLGADERALTLKATLEDQQALVTIDPETYSVAPYVGRFGWIRVRLETVDPDDLQGLILEAWQRTAPKRLVRQHDSGDPAAPGPSP
jgi:hypothetical protein